MLPKIVVFHGILKDSDGSSSSFIYPISTNNYNGDFVKEFRQSIRDMIEKENPTKTVKTINVADITDSDAVKLFLKLSK